jgi:hypothetical protein
MYSILHLSKTSSFWLFSAVLGLGLMAVPASATILCGVTNTNVISNTTPQIVIRATFATTVANQLVDIKYNAECSIAGGPSNWLDTDIVIDPAGAPAPFTCPPSNGDNALCSGDGAATVNDGWISAVTNCVTRIPSTGVHTVFVRVTPFPANTTWRIDDQSLKCEN